MDLRTYKAKSTALYADIEAVLEKHGFKLGKVGAGIDASVGTVRLSLNLSDAALTDAAGKPTTPEAIRFTKFAELYGMKADWLGQTFTMGGKSWSIEGLKERGNKAVIIASGGKRYVCTAEQVIDAKSRAR